MPKTRGEDDKKHGDKLESLIERTGGKPAAGKRSESAEDDEPALLSDDELLADDDDAALLQDDEDEDFENGDIGTDRDVGERE